MEPAAPGTDRNPQSAQPREEEGITGESTNKQLVYSKPTDDHQSINSISEEKLNVDPSQGSQNIGNQSKRQQIHSTGNLSEDQVDQGHSGDRISIKPGVEEVPPEDNQISKNIQITLEPGVTPTGKRKVNVFGTSSGDDSISSERFSRKKLKEEEKVNEDKSLKQHTPANQINFFASKEIARLKPKRANQNSVWRYPEAIPKEGLYVDHAGLVLLHPFLPAYFEACGFLDEEKQFKNGPARVAAVQSLAFLATGELTLPEFQMVLHKILCGMPIKEPLDLYFNVTAEVKAEADQLLKAALNHWKSLKDTSPDGLRVNFLCRNGKITQKDSGWHLQVKREPFDMLLNRLPWGIGLVKLPWLGHIIHVDWY